MRKTLFLFAVLTLPFLSACHKDKPEPQPDGVWVKFQNKTDEDIENIEIRLHNTTAIQVGTIKAGQSSDYIHFDAYPLWNYENSTGPGFLNGELTGKAGGNTKYFSSDAPKEAGIVSSKLPDGKYIVNLNKTFEEWFFNYWLAFE